MVVPGRNGRIDVERPASKASFSLQQLFSEKKVSSKEVRHASTSFFHLFQLDFRRFQTRDSSKSNHSTKIRRRRCLSPRNVRFQEGKSKTRSPPLDDDAVALAEEEEKRHRRRKERKRIEEEDRLRREREQEEEDERIRKAKVKFQLVAISIRIFFLWKKPADDEENYDDDFVQVHRRRSRHFSDRFRFGSELRR